MSSDADQKLARELLSGNKRALRRFHRQYYKRLLAYVSGRVRTREDAEEITQDSFISFLDSLPMFGFGSSLWTFLVAIAKHEIADYFRRLYAKRAIAYVPFIEHIYREPMHSADETAELFYQAMEKLTRKERRLLLWKYRDGLSVSEMAQRLGTGVKAVESRLFRARQSFKVAYVAVSGEEG